MSLSLESLRASGLLSPLDLHFARTMAQLAGESRSEVLAAAALASRYVGAGHVCVDLRTLDAAEASLPELPKLAAWQAALRSSPLVSEENAPLVLDAHGRLYLRRYWAYETRVAEDLSRRASHRPEAPPPAAALEALDRLFPPVAGTEEDPSRRAARASLSARLTVITGGPGTGKTSTVLKLLAVLAEARLANGQPAPRATLLAPTGKAAARLSESIRERKATLPCTEAVKAAIPEATSTIHRALGWRRDQPTRFRHDAGNPLRADVVVVDEASMVDLALLAKLLDAVPEGALLILLGDEDQLSSVEVGAILGDICHSSGAGQETSAPIAGCIFRLEKSHRFDAKSGIGALARAIKAGQADEALALLRDAAHADVRLHETSGLRRLPEPLRALAVDVYRPYLEAESAESRATAFQRFRVLAAHATGPGGVSELNEQLEYALARAGLLEPSGAWYDRRPIMVRENDYELELYNGDIGFVVRGADGQMHTELPGPGATTRTLSPARLPSHETVFAMTIHKSQGSEMDEVAVVLPEQVSRVLSRELLYTAVTRARTHVTVFARPEVLGAAVERRVQRASGLTERLWQAG